MTQFSDQLFQGNAYFQGAANWDQGNTTGIPSAASPYDTQGLGVPHTQTFAYQIGTASTALASGVFYSATGTATGTLTATGALAVSGVATMDVPRGLRFTSSTNLATITVTVAGTDGYGQRQTWAGTLPTGNTFGNTGSYVDTTVTFKTASSISVTNTTGTTAFAIGTNNTYGLPYYIPNVGCVLGTFIDGQTATVPGTVTAGLTATGTPTATTADVRGTVALATVVLANDTRYITIHMIQPPSSFGVATDDRVHSYGAIPYTA